ncbi:recombinase family protein [Pseudomonas donghuensis]|uniref:recombinase family protein n=1 Tax=Pseudomonas donghuensis TaxID=1163398 RepID=UPI0021601F7F|nr:recombinase family protein [Pseudomonas donghuensis]UVL23717.1 recombinase family protein [Pseudomonas donghuensis]
MPVAVPYIRFSSEEQRHGSSLNRQEDKVDEWLARNPEYTRYQQTFRDLGLSGFNGHHVTEGALGKLLDAIEKEHIPAGSVVLVEAIDRFSRLEPMQTLRNLEIIVKAGIQFITLEDNQRYDATCLTDHRLLFLAMKAQAAHGFSKRLSDMVTGSYTDRAKEAKKGEPIKRRNPFWLTSEGELKKVESEALGQVFNAFSNGVPLRALAIQYAQYFGNRQSLKHALRNPAAIGHWQRTTTVEVDGKRKRVEGELIKNVFKPAITEELFYQVQKLLDDLAARPSTVARKFFLAGLLQCGECTANMVLLRQNARQQTDAVRCYRRMQNSDKCTNQKTIPVPVAAWFYHETKKAHALRAYQRTRLPENKRQRIKLEGQIAQIERQQASLWRLVEMDPDNKDAVASYGALTAEKNQLKDALASIPELVSDGAILGFSFIKFLYGDSFAVANLLQMDGYRIICHRDGTLEVNRSADDHPAATVKYVGYARKHKKWSVEYPDGDTMLVP